MPKTGGTSLCSIFQTLNMDVSKSNCWIPEDGPEWCCLSETMLKERTCTERLNEKNKPIISMIERYMDTNNGVNETLICPKIRYGILIRNPLDRAISHLKHFARFRKSTVLLILKQYW